jgi:hypothetical protein
METIQVVENYTPCGVDVAKIVNRILRHAPPGSIDGLKRIVLLDANPKKSAFGCYWNESSQIDLYMQYIIGDLPWLLRKTYIIPYLFIGMALGHEIDHHVYRAVISIDKEAHAEANSMKYVYPSLGCFKPMYRLFVFVYKVLAIVRSAPTGSRPSKPPH